MRKKKIYTLTTHFANNYGALLQAYALSKYLNSFDDVECEILNYLPSGPQKYNRSWTIFHKPKTFKDFLKLLYLMVRIDKIQVRRNKNSVMRHFIQNELPVTDKKLYESTINKEKIVADAVICGSDQIWNREIFTDTAYFLDFVPDETLKISYAASIATAWNQEDVPMIQKFLKRFDRISIREIANYKQVSDIVPDKQVEIVCDPVFLLSADDWKSFSKEPQIREPYIFCYFLGTSKLAEDTVGKLKKLTGLKIVHLNVNALDKFNSDIILKVADPHDFVGLIRNASYVCTNSFHCSAFSIIFKKNLYTIPNTRRNERLENLQLKFHVNFIVTEKKYFEMQESNLNIDYSECDLNGHSFISSSKNFIKKGLNEL